MDWDLQISASIRRTELHARYGGGGQGGISPSAQSPNVLIFTDPNTGEQHGYHDEFAPDGSFSYTGEGQKGDQVLKAGNRALLEHRAAGRAVRLFKGTSGVVEYAGEYAIDPIAPFSYRDAPSSGGGPLRSVIVFKLWPVEHVGRAISRNGTPQMVTTVDIELRNTERVTVEGGREDYEIERREAALVHAFKAYWEAQGHKCVRQRIVPPGSSERLYTDLFLPSINLLVEAKGTTSRDSFRSALGQLLDYRRHLGGPDCAILLPSEPRADLLDLARSIGIDVFWQTSDASQFRRHSK